MHPRCKGLSSFRRIHSELFKKYCPCSSKQNKNTCPCHYKAWKSKDMFLILLWLDSSERRKSYRTPWGWVRHGLILIFSWTSPLTKCFYPSMFLFLLSVCLSHSFYSAAVATNAVHTSSDITNTYLGKTGAGVELLVTVWMLLVLLVLELFCTGEESWARGTFPIRYQIPMLFSSLWGNIKIISPN